MKYIVFPDCHYGYKGGAKVFISEVVDKYETMYDAVDKIIILGDFIDFWRRTVSDVLIKYKELFDYLESQKEYVVYCKGNHDFIIDELLSERNINVVDRYISGCYVFEHGHYLDYLSMSKMFISLDDFNKFAKDMCYSDTTSGNFLSRVWGMYRLVKNGFGRSIFKCGSGEVNHKFSKLNDLSRVLYGKYRKAVIGHFHFYWKGKNLISLPAFCDGYFTVFDNGKFEYYKYNDGRISCVVFK